MSHHAQVKSVEALAAFRTTLVLYRDKAIRTLDDVREEVVRTRTWLETDRQLHWRRLIRDREARLAQADQELLTARLSGHPEAIQDRRMAVYRARAALEEAQQGLGRVRHWLNHYQSEIDPRLKPLLHLRQFLATDTEQALNYLANSTTILAEYSAPGTPAPSNSAPSPVSVSPNTPAPTPGGDS
jgi:hypothetical protein